MSLAVLICLLTVAAPDRLDLSCHESVGEIAELEHPCTVDTPLVYLEGCEAFNTKDCICLAWYRRLKAKDTLDCAEILAEVDPSLVDGLPLLSQFHYQWHSADICSDRLKVTSDISQQLSYLQKKRERWDRFISWFSTLDDSERCAILDYQQDCIYEAVRFFAHSIKEANDLNKVLDSITAEEIITEFMRLPLNYFSDLGLKLWFDNFRYRFPILVDGSRKEFEEELSNYPHLVQAWAKFKEAVTIYGEDLGPSIRKYTGLDAQ